MFWETLHNLTVEHKICLFKKKKKEFGERLHTEHVSFPLQLWTSENQGDEAETGDGEN